MLSRPLKTLLIVSIIVAISLGSSIIAQGGHDGGDGYVHTKGVYSGTRAEPPSKEWPQFMGDLNNTGFSSTRIPLAEGTLPLWTATVPNLKATNSIVVENDIVYLGSADGKIRGLDIDSGETVFEKRICNKHISGTPSVHSGVLYVGADDGHLYGIDLSSGNEVLDVDLNTTSIVTSPKVHNGRVFIGTQGRDLMNSQLYAVNIGTSEIDWNLSMGDSLNIYGFQGTVAVNGGRVFAGDGKGRFYCLDEEGFGNGNDGFTGEADTSPDAPDIIWSFNASSSVTGSPTVADGKVYLGTDIGVLHCLEADIGGELWNRTVGSGTSPNMQTCPAYHNDTLYVTAQRAYGEFGLKKGGSVWALEPDDGVVKWRYNTSGQVVKSSPIVVEDALVFGGGSGNTSLFCISTSEDNLADEERVNWYIRLAAPVVSSPAVANGRVFIARPDPSGGTGKVYAVGSPDPEMVSLEMSDPSPFVGEKVRFTAKVVNNATVECIIGIEFKVSNFNFSDQILIGRLQNISLRAFEEKSVGIDWVVKPGYQMLVATIDSSFPEDEDRFNNFETINIQNNMHLEGYWTMAGANSRMTSGSSRGLDSNRTYWSLDLGSPLDGPMEPLWYDGFGGNGSAAAVGGNLFFTGPEGELIALNSTPEGETPGTLWEYYNSSVNFMGRPALLIDKDQTWSAPNKVFISGDDSAIWAFDWVGFWDGQNDGPYDAEGSTGKQVGDVLWRAPIPSKPSRPLMVSGGNVIISGEDGVIHALDDDTGNLEWSRPGDYGPMASSTYTLYLSDGSVVDMIDPTEGDLILSMNMSTLMNGSRIRSLSIIDDTLVLTGSSSIHIIDLDPDDNGDGEIDADDEDEGVEDNVTGVDLLSSVSVGERITMPPSFTFDSEVMGVVASDLLYFINLENGSQINNISLPDAPTGRLVSGGSSFYVVTGSSPYVLRAYSPSMSGRYEDTWIQALSSRPTGEAAIVKGHMYISTIDGKIKSLGAPNSPPVSIIDDPSEGILIFPGEEVILDASSSFDPEGDSLVYAWFLEGSILPIYEGPETIVNLSFIGVGKKKLTLRVYDDMRAWSESSVNLTLLKRVTSPDFDDPTYDIYIHMSFGISEPSGGYFINITEPPDTPQHPGAIFTAHLEFLPLPRYASYRFEWANVSIGFVGRQFPVSMHEEEIGIFRYDETSDSWIRAGITGVDISDGLAYGNFSDLKAGYYSVGILDNSIPQFRHQETTEYVFKPERSRGYTFKVEYRDQDGDRPDFLKLHVDNSSTYSLSPSGFTTNVTRFTFYSVEGVNLDSGWHSYYFETDDGHFIVRSDYYDITIANSLPVPSINGPSGVVFVKETILLSGEGSYDADGDELKYYWDLDGSNGIQRDRKGEKISHQYFEPGVYKITLTVSDNFDEASTNITLTVVERPGDDDEGPKAEEWGLIGLFSFLGVLIIAVAVFIFVSRKARHVSPETDEEIERWSCPECGNSVGNGNDECPECGYVYDPLDFDHEMDEM